MMTGLNSRTAQTALLGAAIVLFVVLATAGIITKAPWGDEGWVSNPAYNLLKTGYLATTLVYWPGGEKYDYYALPFCYLVQAGFYAVFGWGLWQMRAISLAFGLLFLGSWFTVLRRLDGPTTLPVLGVVMVALDFVFLAGASDGRPDIMITALGGAAWAIYLTQRERHRLLAFALSHLLVCLAGLTHPMGLLYFVGLVFLQLQHERSNLRKTDVLASFVPYLLGAAAWGLYIFQDIDLFKQQFFTLAGARIHDGTADLWLSFSSEFTGRYARTFGLAEGGSSPLAKLKAINLAAYVIGTLYCLYRAIWRADHTARIVLVLWLPSIVLMPMISGNRNGYYLVHATPFFATFLALMADRVRAAAPLPRRLMWAALIVVTALQAGGFAWKAVTATDSTRPVSEFLMANAAPEDRIAGPAQLVFHLRYRWALIQDIGTDLALLRQRPPVFFVLIAEDAAVLPEKIDEICEPGNQPCHYRIAYEDKWYRVYKRQS